MDISGCSSRISFDHAFRISRSCASYHEGAFWLPFLRVAEPSVEEEVVIGGSTGTDFSGSGLIPRWISKSADGRQGRSREERLIAPCKKVLER